MAKFSQFAVPVGMIVLGGILIATGWGAGPGTALAKVGAAGVGLTVSGGLGIIGGLISSSGQEGYSSSPTYSAVRVTNHRGDGEPIPYVYGEEHLTPLCIHTGLSTNGLNDLVERVYLLGWGEMEVYRKTSGSGLFWTDPKKQAQVNMKSLLSRITLNDVSITEMDPLAHATVLTTSAGQDLGKVPYFNQVGRPYVQTPTKLDKDVEHLYTMAGEADEAHIVFDWPNGLLKVDSGGDWKRSASGVRFEYRDAEKGDVSTNPWIKANLGGKIETSTGGFTVTLKRPTDPDISDDVDTSKPPGILPDGATPEDLELSNLNPDWTATAKHDNINKRVAGQYYTSGKSRSFVRRVAVIRFQTRGRYEIRLTGLTSDDSNDVRAATVSLIIEHSAESVCNIPGVTLLAVRFKAKEQLRGAEPILKIQCLGRKIKKLEDSMNVGWSDNVASVAYDLLTDVDGSVGLWFDTSDIDDGVGGTWRTIATTLENNTITATPTGGGAAVTEKLGRCNLVVDTLAPASDWLNRILSIGYCWAYESEGLLKLVRDEVKSSVRTYEARVGQSGCNVLKTAENASTLEMTEIESKERYNSFVVEYRDKDELWAQRKTPKLTTSAAVGSTIPEKALRLFMPGITSEAQAKEFRNYLKDRTVNSVQLVRFGVSWGELDVEPGDRITVNADWLGWAGSTKDFNVQGIQYGVDGSGVIIGREYSAGGQTSSSDTVRPPTKKPAAPPFQATIDSQTGAIVKSGETTAKQGTSLSTTIPAGYPKVGIFKLAASILKIAKKVI
jgi:hypothetical protein